MRRQAIQQLLRIFLAYDIGQGVMQGLVYTDTSVLGQVIADLNHRLLGQIIPMFNT